MLILVFLITNVNIKLLLLNHQLNLNESDLTPTLTIYIYVLVDLAFLHMHFYSMANSFFIWKRFIFLENDLELPLIFVLFLKKKQNKKENPKCDSLFGKDGL